MLSHQEIWNGIRDFDPELVNAIDRELHRQETHLELIASENYASAAVMAVQGTVLTNKYAEGYPNKRYYGGCEYVDIVEQLAIDRARELFGAKYVNVQPHSGSQANAAAYAALISPGDTILGMSLSEGGHLTHGAKPNFSGKWYHSLQYGIDPSTGEINYAQIASLAKDHQPKLIIGGFSAYPRIVDWQKLRAIADDIGAYLLVDMAHVAGLVAADLYPSPVGIAHVCTTTTHKTLRGPRGGLILCNDEKIAKKIDSMVFPGTQGGPFMHTIAAKALALKEALTPEFRSYQRKVIENATTLAKVLIDRGYLLVTGGTSNHIILINLSERGVTGKHAETLLGAANITVNKNTVPNDPQSPFVTSGIRLGTPALTTRGFDREQMMQVGHFIADVLDVANADKVIYQNICDHVKEAIIELCGKFPVYN